MSRVYQYFIAPGDEESDILPIEESPWWDDITVRIPKKYWDLILDFAVSIEPEKAKILREYSEPEDGDEMISPELGQLTIMVSFISQLQEAVARSEPIVPKDLQNYPDQYYNESLVDMLTAVQAVFKWSLDSGEPFESLIEL